jgi:hypothetical protein
MAQTPQDQGWRSLAAQASKEMDEEKLLRLVDQLCNASTNVTNNLNRSMIKVAPLGKAQAENSPLPKLANSAAFIDLPDSAT